MSIAAWSQRRLPWRRRSHLRRHRRFAGARLEAGMGRTGSCHNYRCGDSHGGVFLCWRMRRVSASFMWSYHHCSRTCVSCRTVPWPCSRSPKKERRGLLECVPVAPCSGGSDRFRRCYRTGAAAGAAAKSSKLRCRKLMSTAGSCSRARSAANSPNTGENLNPFPENPRATVTRADVR